MLLTPFIKELYILVSTVTVSYSFNQLLSLFFLYALMGWGLETLYRSFSHRRFFNPGFLTGPIVPLYGFAGIFVMVTIVFTHEAPLLVRLLIYFITITVMEYFTGEIMYRLFKRRFWDYSDNLLNVRGHVCLPFSIAWAVLSLVFEFTIHPLSMMLVSLFKEDYLMLLNGGGLLLLQLDFIYSISFRHPGHLNDIRKRLAGQLSTMIPGAVFQQTITPLIQLRHRINRLQQTTRHLEKFRKWKR